VLATVMPEAIRNSTNDAYGINAEWAITPRFALFGRYGLASTQVNAFDGYAFSGVRSNTWHVGFALPNLFAPGNNLSVAYGQPVRVFAGTAAGLATAGLTTSLVPSGTEGNIEIFYRLRLNDSGEPHPGSAIHRPARAFAQLQRACRRYFAGCLRILRTPVREAFGPGVRRSPPPPRVPKCTPLSASPPLRAAA
jgi:hypothetical protein